MVVNGDDYIAPEGWEELSATVLEGAPFKVWANNFKSGSERLRAFMDDPRKFLMGGSFDGNYGDITGEEIAGVDEDTRISTWITNHHNTLLRMILYATAIHSPKRDSNNPAGEDTVAVTLYKYDPGD